MYLLPCTSCDAGIPVSPSQAGGQAQCPLCGASVDIPKLGELRLLAKVEETVDSKENLAGREASGARSIGFGLFAFLAAGCLLVGSFCGIRWFLTDVPLTSEQHIAELRQQYKAIEPAQLIREYEQMEKYGLELPEPYTYQIAANAKRDWGRNALIAGGLGSVCGLIAVLLAATARRKQAI